MIPYYWPSQFLVREKEQGGLLHDHVSETHDGIMRRTIRIDSTLATLEEKGSKFYPPLEIPQRRRKK